MNLVLLAAILLSCLTIETRGTKRDSIKQDLVAGLNQTLDAFERLLSFYEVEVKDVNLDGIYGLRVAEGALKQTLTEHDALYWQATTVTKHFRQQLVQFSKRAGSVCERAQESIRKQGQGYYERFKHVVDKPWSFFSAFGQRKLPALESMGTARSYEEHTWDEKLSDYCMSEVLGSNVNNAKCLFTEKCVKGVTDLLQTEYGPTHQILFLTLAIMNKCEKKYSKILVDQVGFDVRGLVENRCVKVMEEMLELERRGVSEEREGFGVSTYDQDIYLEQGFVCAMHGYEEFLSLKRLRNVLRWQEYPGCFGNITEDGFGPVKITEEVFGEVNEDVSGVSGVPTGSPEETRRRRGANSYSSMRRLLVDRTLDHGCSSHESGVAAGLLSLYIKWLLTKLDSSLLAPTLSSSVQSTICTVHKDTKIYILTIFISFVTSIVTIAIVFALYKWSSHCLRSRTENRYKKLTASNEDKYLI